MAKDRIGVGIIGANLTYGFGTKAHLPALTHLPEFEVAAVCTQNDDTAQATAAQFGIPRTFTDPKAMIQDPSVDLVTVCVRVPSHYVLVEAAIEAGKHVYCEWPLGSSLKQTEQLRDLAVAENVVHAVGLQGRGGPAVNYLKDLIAEGFVGDVLSSAMLATLPGAGERRAFKYSAEGGGGTLHIPGGHSLDLLGYVLGDFAELTATTSIQLKTAIATDTGRAVTITTPDQVLVNGYLENGAIASAHIQTLPNAKMGLTLQICGTEGMIIATGDFLWMQEIALQGFSKTGRSGWPTEFAPLAVPDRYVWVPADVPNGYPFNVAQLYRKVGAAIRDGAADYPDFNLAVRRAALLDTILSASDDVRMRPISQSDRDSLPKIGATIAQARDRL
jgi:predicted dehydrogenase